MSTYFRSRIMLVARVAMKYLYRQIPRHNPAQLVVPATLLPEGIYMDFPAELRLQPDGETLTPYPTLDLGNDYLGHGKRPQSDPKSATQLI